ncbi:MAG TPA: ribonuclease P protein component [Nocardioides sp.]|nr:ribonuclease P protein component [Nocardioides sp.]
MLNRANRLTSGRMFAPTIRRGRRAGTRRLVVHLDPAPAARTGAATPLVGFVVSKAVGPAVVRNRVRRRLRHLARERLRSLPGSAVLVVRALPASAQASSTELGEDLDTALARVLPAEDRR